MKPLNDKLQGPVLGQRGQQGFSLIEALIALVVISLGMMGVASMLVVAVGNTSVARTRTIAAQLANSLSASMSANRAYWATATPPTATITITGSAITGTGSATLSSASTNCATTTCTSVQMASYDLKQWGGLLAGQLPNGTGEFICPSVTLPRSCQINVKWSEKNLAAKQASGAVASNARTFTVVVQP